MTTAECPSVDAAGGAAQDGPIDSLLSELGAALERTGECRVLRRLHPREHYSDLTEGDPTRIGLALDTETTGLDTGKDEPIELAMVMFTYGEGGRIGRILGTFSALNQPSVPIPSEVTALTGIDDAMVAGHRIDGAAVEAFAAPANICIAHHAAYDRMLVERFWPVFASKHWGCSATEVDWKGEGFESARLAQILSGFGYFHSAHRALDDCRALVEILSRPLPRSLTPALGALLDRARRPTVRIRAEAASYESRHRLKARRYRWHDGSDGTRKCWFIDVDEDLVDQEVRFLRTEIYGRDVDLPTARLTSLDRFSVRCSGGKT